ncbi:MAG: hypothetical protein V8Q30_05435 [Acutalibacteraceae bacterium]
MGSLLDYQQLHDDRHRRSCGWRRPAGGAVPAGAAVFSRRADAARWESYEKQKQFITDAGHEIKTPLAVIDADAEVLELETWGKTSGSRISRTRPPVWLN